MKTDELRLIQHRESKMVLIRFQPDSEIKSAIINNGEHYKACYFSIGWGIVIPHINWKMERIYVTFKRFWGIIAAEQRRDIVILIIRVFRK